MQIRDLFDSTYCRSRGRRGDDPERVLGVRCYERCDLAWGGMRVDV
jgi:hypothetical protein